MIKKQGRKKTKFNRKNNQLNNNYKWHQQSTLKNQYSDTDSTFLNNMPKDKLKI